MCATVFIHAFVCCVFYLPLCSLHTSYLLPRSRLCTHNSGVCSGGKTNHEANSDIDCDGVCFGNATCAPTPVKERGSCIANIIFYTLLHKRGVNTVVVLRSLRILFFGDHSKKKSVYRARSQENAGEERGSSDGICEKSVSTFFLICRRSSSFFCFSLSFFFLSTCAHV